MTTYIPSLTLPSVIFENAALSVLLPIAAGTAVGFSTQRKNDTYPEAIISILTFSQP
jgi:benzodiazapine receptor